MSILKRSGEDNQSIGIRKYKMSNQQIKSDKKAIAIASLIFGTFSIIPVVLLVSGFFLPYSISEKLSELIPTLLEMILFITFPSGVLGLIFGKMGLKSTERKAAIIGIIFSIIGLLMFILSMAIALWYQSIIYPAPGIFR